jgi:hypothetical protein
VREQPLVRRNKRRREGERVARRESAFIVEVNRRASRSQLHRLVRLRHRA